MGLRETMFQLTEHLINPEKYYKMIQSDTGKSIQI